MSIYSTAVLRILTEPERKVFDSGSYVTKFYGGSSEGKDKNGNYINNAIDVEVWNKTGDILFGETAYVSKGGSVQVNGKLVQQKWTDSSGQERSKHVLEASRVELLSRDSGAAPASAPAPTPAAATNSSPFGAASSVEDDEIPF